jgi:phenylalanyl-tRNA synthetase alpha chain
MDPIAAFHDYEKAALVAIEQADSADAIELVRIEFLGQKKGRLRELQALLGTVAKEERPELGKQFNLVKKTVAEALQERQNVLSKPQSTLGGLDIALPGRRYDFGRPHPLTQTMEEFKDIMGRFGFTVAEGPEIEDEHHNFIALNIPEVHPARDPLDNFYLATAGVVAGTREAGESSPVLLRSQTSTVQIRVMEQTAPPVRIVSLGRCYRPDTIDATHHCMFHQMEGLMVADDVTMAQLKSVLTMFATAYLGHDVAIRFRPSFFPFTEPSVEVDMKWGDDWLEIGGAGMVDPNVLSSVGYDPEQVSGFAFGMGIERFCMKRHGITDIRRFFENDVRFLAQF